MGLLENADYVALDVAIAVHVRGLQTGPVLVENQPFRIRQIIGLPMVGARPIRTAPIGLLISDTELSQSNKGG